MKGTSGEENDPKGDFSDMSSRRHNQRLWEGRAVQGRGDFPEPSEGESSDDG